MTWIAISLLLAASAPDPPSPPVWRLLDVPVHVGARIAAHVSPEEEAVGFTIQLSAHTL